MNTYLSGGLIKNSRKDHFCSGCYRRIPKGTLSYISNSIYEGDFSSFRSCLDCEEYINSADAKDWGDGFPCGFALEEDLPYRKLPILEPQAKS